MKSMDQNLKSDIINLIKTNIPLINFHFDKANIPPRSTGCYYTSQEFLTTLTDDDTVTGEHKYYYNFGHLSISDQLYSYIEQMFPEYIPRVSGHFYYPPGGFMSWHTNSDMPQKHVYITYVDNPSQSFFRTYSDGNIITNFDNDELVVRVFDIVDTKPYYWHCVYSDCNRYSFGFRLFKK